MRKLAITAAVISSTLVPAIFFWRISPLLPERGGTTCFAADYTPPRPVDLSSPRRDRRSTGEISSMRLAIHFPPEEKPYRNGTGGGYDWRYALQLDARLANSERLSTAAICEASDSFVDRILPALFCYIDCEGGSVTVWRRFGQNALSVRFEAGERLQTGDSCGDGGAVFIGAETETRSFPVVPQQQCAEN
jgi:hypothetical protein